MTLMGCDGICCMCGMAIGVNATQDAAGGGDPGDIWSASDEVSYIPSKVCHVSSHAKILVRLVLPRLC